jgi:hypothetical protein
MQQIAGSVELGLLVWDLVLESFLKDWPSSFRVISPFATIIELVFEYRQGK